MKIGGRKNFGYGRSIGYAIRNVLLDRFGAGNYGTRYSHESRLSSFSAYLKARRIKDLRDVSADVVEDYAQQLKDAVEDATLAKPTAVNRLSSVNVLFSEIRIDKACWLSPRDCIGSRTRVRQQPPLGLNPETVWAAAETARERGERDIAVAIVLCRFVGTRIREAALLDLRKAAKSALDLGLVTIVRGSKGNRAKSIPREIVVSERFAEWLDASVTALGSRILVPESQTFRSWYLSAYRRFGPLARLHSLHSGFHDLRAGYACDRYREITSIDAPCVLGKRLVDAENDRRARETIACELGHGRIDVTGAYLGGRR